MASCLLYPPAMKLITVVVMSSVALAGCGKQENPFEHVAKFGGTQAAKPEEAKPELSAFKTRALAELAKITEFKDAMCKCRDRACATKVHESHEAWTNAQPPDHTKPGPGEEAEMIGKMKTVFDEERACIEKAIASSAPANPKAEAKAKVVAQIAAITTFKNTICKCAKGDAECATKVLNDNEALLERWQKAPEEIAKLDPADARELQKLLVPAVDGYMACMKAALHGDDASSIAGSKLNGAQTKAVTAIGRADALKEAMCKCKPGDSTCALALLKSQQEWAAESERAPKDGSSLTAAEKADFLERFEPIMADYKKCMKTALGVAQ